MREARGRVRLLLQIAMCSRRLGGEAFAKPIRAADVGSSGGRSGVVSSLPPCPIVLLLIDGLGDADVPSLSYRTPLAAAYTPCLDVLASVGASGLMDPVLPGAACGSDTAHLSLFGLDPRGLYRGRGAFETIGAGLAMRRGDVAFKSNFAHVDPSTGVVLSRRADRRLDAHGPAFAAALDGLAIPGFPEHRLRAKHATEHRAGVLLSGPGLSDAIVGTDPLKDNLPLVQPRPLDPSDRDAALTCRVLVAASRLASEVLAAHPANAQRLAEGKVPVNAVLFRGPGGLPDLTPFAQLHGGARLAAVAPTRIVAGLAQALGAVDADDVPGATGDYFTDFDAKVDAVVRILKGKRAGERQNARTNKDEDREQAKEGVWTPSGKEEVWTSSGQEEVWGQTSGCKDGEEDDGNQGAAAGDARQGGDDEGIASCGKAASPRHRGSQHPRVSFPHRRADCVLLHIKAVDDAGHDRLAGGKAHLLECVDRAARRLVRALAAGAPDDDALLCVLGDHSTPVHTGDHSWEPVPVAVAWAGDVQAKLSETKKGRPGSQRCDDDGDAEDIENDDDDDGDDRSQHDRSRTKIELGTPDEWKRNEEAGRWLLKEKRREQRRGDLEDVRSAVLDDSTSPQRAQTRLDSRPPLDASKRLKGKAPIAPTRSPIALTASLLPPPPNDAFPPLVPRFAFDEPDDEQTKTRSAKSPARRPESARGEIDAARPEDAGFGGTLSTSDQTAEVSPKQPAAVSPAPARESFDDWGFCERSAARGTLGRFPGAELMPLLKRLAGWEQEEDR